MDERSRTLTFRAILLGVSLVSLGQTIVVTAMPRITAELGGTDRYAWVAGAYLITSVLVMLPAGRLVDLMNARLLLLGSTVVFLVGSVLCGLSPSMDVLIAWRAVQGVGGGALMSVNAAVLGLMYPPRERGAVMGSYTAAVSVANVVGPLLGGFLSDVMGWSSVFFIPVPLGVVALYILWRHMPDMQPVAAGRMDWWGTWVLCVAIVPLLLAFSWAGTKAPWGSATILGLLGLSGALFAVFVVLETRQADPLFDLRLMREPVYSWSSLALLTAGGNLMVAIVYIPLYLVGVSDVSPTISGVVLCPLMLGATIGATLTGHVVRTTGRYRSLLVGGSLVHVASLAVLQRLMAAGASAWWILAVLLPMGIALGVLLPALTVAVQDNVPRERMGTATSSVQFFRTLGASLAVAVTGTLLTTTLLTKLPGHLPPQVSHHGVHRLAKGFNEGDALHRRFTKRVTALQSDIHQAIAGDGPSRERLASHPLLHRSLVEGLEHNQDPAVLEQHLDARTADMARALENALHAALRDTLIDACASIMLLALGMAAVGAVASLVAPHRPLGHTRETP